MMIYMMMVMLMVMLLTLVHPCNSSRSSNSKYASRDTKKQQQQHASSSSSPPNIVVLLADNLAYEDVGIFRQQQQPQRRSRRTPTPTRTPNLDQIASEGRRLYNWNSPAVLCSASRAALLTGKYPVRKKTQTIIMVVSLFSDLCASDTNKKNGGFVFDIPICIFLFSDGSCSNFFLSLFSSRFLSFLLHYLDSYGYEPTSQIYVMKKLRKDSHLFVAFATLFVFTSIIY